jgi:hypothetical protein
MVQAANKVTSEALEEEDEAPALLERMDGYVAALKEEYDRSCRGGARRLLTGFDEFMAADFADGEQIAFHARRGEIANLQSGMSASASPPGPLRSVTGVSSKRTRPASNP